MQRENKNAETAVLVVDDDPVVRALMDTIFSREGYFVTVAKDGAGALVAAESRPFQLAFIDLRLPDADGTDLIAPLRAKCPDVGVLIFTAHASIESASDAVRQGADSYIIKPSRREQILEEARSVLEKRRLARENRRLLQAAREELARRRRVEGELRQATEEMEIILDSVPATIWFKDTQNHLVRVNRAAAESVGLPADELAGMPCEDIFPEEAEHYYADDLEVIRSGKPKYGIIEPLQVSPTEKRWVRTDKVPYRERDGSVSGVLVFALDITDTMKAEEARRAADANYRSLLEDSTDAVLVIAAQQQVVYRNPVATQLLRDGGGELVDRIAKRRPDSNRTLKVRAESGECVDFDVEITRTEWEGQPAQLVTLRDITARITAERKQRRTGRRLAVLRSVDRGILLAQSLEEIAEAVLQHLPNLVPFDWAGILEFTPEPSPVANRDVARLLGVHDATDSIDLQAGEVVHTAVFQPLAATVNASRRHRVRRVPARPRCAIEVALDRVGLPFYAVIPFMAGDELLGCLVVACRRRKSFGREDLAVLSELSKSVSVALKQSRLNAALSEQTLNLQRTVEELQKTRQQLDREERLTALGKMASGMVHEFNNSLAPILGFSDMIMKRPEIVEDRERLQRFLRNICTAARDAASTVDQLRDFYRPRKAGEERQSVDLEDTIESAVALARARIGSSDATSHRFYDIQTDLETTSAVTAHETDLRQALINLLYNAAEAMPNGGAIEVVLHESDAHAVIEVRDSGVGMDEETRQRCLEPFFTTKTDTGSGLGLAMVYGFARRHNGRIDVESTPGRGTTFTIRLPLVPVTGSALPVGADTAVVKRLRILVVEPDDGVRGMLMEYTAQDGHTVSTAVTTEEGLERFRQSRFDLVMIATEADGESLKHAMAVFHRKRPVIPVVVLSDSGDVSVLREKKRSVDIVLRKPLTLADFRMAVKRAVEASIRPA